MRTLCLFLVLASASVLSAPLAEGKNTTKTAAALPQPLRRLDEGGLRGPTWMRGVFIPGGDPTQPPPPLKVRAIPPSDGGTQSASTTTDVRSLVERSFSEVAARVQIPQDVALFLRQSISYYDERGERQDGGSWGSWSSGEVLTQRRGVCRDQHALARDLLIARGYEAALLGYSAPDQSHAITAYRDPQSGKWGILEYGTLFAPSVLQASSPEEALMKVRPAALAISRYSNGGPTQPSHVDGIIYTPAARSLEQFMAGPAPQAGTGVVATNGGLTAMVSSPDGLWQGAIRVTTDPELPYLRESVMAVASHTFSRAQVRLSLGGGYLPHTTEHRVSSNNPLVKPSGFAFLSVEEHHPWMTIWDNIGGSGIRLGFSSHARLQLVLATGREATSDPGSAGTALDIDGASVGMSSLRWSPSLTAERVFSLWSRDRADTRVHLSFGGGIDGGLLLAHYTTGGSGLPINLYASGGLTTSPRDWLVLSVQGYVPITNHTNDFADDPLFRLELNTPYIRLGMTQGRKQARYEAAALFPIGRRGRLSAFVAADHDRVTGQAQFQVGVGIGTSL